MPVGTEKAALFGSGTAGPPDEVEYLVLGGGGGASNGTAGVNLGSSGAGGIHKTATGFAVSAATNITVLSLIHI